jgi:hypothetical protein
MRKVKYLTVRTASPVGELPRPVPSASPAALPNLKFRRSTGAAAALLSLKNADFDFFRFDCECLRAETHAKTSPELFERNDSLRLTVRRRAATLTG